MASPRLGEPGTRYALNTPALILDLDALERNVARMAEAMRQAGRGLRPHAKSHKSVRIARAQIEAGAVGICCATLDEAEIMASAAIPGILVTSPIATAPKIARLVELARQAPDTMIVVDDPRTVEALSAAARRGGVTLRLLVDIELGFGRTGVVSAEAAEHLARAIHADPFLQFCGLQAYGGHLQHAADHEERVALCRRAHAFISAIVRHLGALGLPPAMVTGGGTGSHAIDAAEGPFTEIQAGSYVFMDAEYRAVSYAKDTAWPFENALFVQTAVISAHGAGTVTTDAGTKSFALNGPKPPIATPRFAGAAYDYAGDEHGRVRAGPGGALPGLGELIECVVPHCDPTVVLYDHFCCVRQDRLVDIWPVDARGRR
ncbi:DSD1 family PLP-dependent enzyme [Aureimonas populi]|uniref:DSD1 family PLP-dependent enzyme n=1 Tax=Aureimonas populi TaxID=1701758 RepID=A0ABW5CP31_9HYPH|nr:DSD1 family PLP-dependent enzyme [Aureimonas populi]